MNPSKKRLTLIPLAAGLSLMLAGGVALASSPAANTDWWDTMHDSKLMQQMRSQMPAGLQEQCDQMHDRMAQWLTEHPDVSGRGPGGMMGGSGMMGF